MSRYHSKTKPVKVPAGMLPMTNHTAKVLKANGIVPLELQRELADFYVLESLATTHGTATLRGLLKDKERFLAIAFGRYFDMILGGELRHWSEQRGCEECGGMHRWECDECAGDGWTDCWQCVNGQVDCPECSGTGTNYCEDEHDGDPCDNPDCVECEHCDSGHIDCDNWDCSGGRIECDYCYGSGHYECDYCTGYDEGTFGVEDSPLVKFLDKVWRPTASTKMPHAGKRNFAWSEWTAFRKKHGTDALRWAVECFNEGGWRSGYGGEAWGSIAQLVLDWTERRISDRVFVNMAWSIEHNGGCAFDKVYAVCEYRNDGYGYRWSLSSLLDVQARDEYDRLVQYASPLVRNLYNHYKWVEPRWEHDEAWLGVQRTTDLVDGEPLAFEYRLTHTDTGAVIRERVA